MSKIAVLGSGGFGLSLSIMADKIGHKVTVWSAFSEEIEMLKREREHKKLLPGVKINESIDFVSDISLISDNDIVIFAIPSAFVRKIAHQAAPFISRNSVIVNTGKGLEDKTYKRLSEVLSEEYPDNPIVILSGPSHAEEVARGMPTTVVAASNDRKYADYIQDQISNQYFRIYVSDDIVGCELGGALKNIIALCAGICDGMGYGDNTKAALMTRGMAEISRLGIALGAEKETFLGLAGVGDLIVTCTSMHSRNRRCGIMIGEGMKPEEATKKVGMVVEGMFTTEAAYELAKKAEVEMPITEGIYRIIKGEVSAKEAAEELMGRDRKHEKE